jgi:hypothetical protein
MFNLDVSATYWWPVKFSVPRETGAIHDIMTFDVEYKRIPVEELDALLKRAADERLSDNHIATQLVAGWKGVETKAGAPVPFSEANFKRALALSRLGSALVATYFESQAKGPAKN